MRVGTQPISPGGAWFVNGASQGAENRYTFLRLSDARTLHAGPLQRGPWTRGDLRIDAAPCWNRQTSAIVAPGLACRRIREAAAKSLRSRGKPFVIPPPITLEIDFVQTLHADLA